MLKKLLWSFIDTISMTLLQFLAIIILSRILNPEDYGTVGAVSIFIAIGNMLIDSGMGGAIVQKKEATSADYSTLFFFNLVISIVLYILYFVFSKSIEDFYGFKGLSSIIRVLALVLIISSLGVVQITRLTRELKFKELAITSFISSLLGLLVAFIVAINGGGAWALVWQQVVISSCKTVLYSYFNRFTPSIHFSFVAFRYQFKFGFGLLIANIVNSIYVNFTSSLIPKISSTIENGYYLQSTKVENVPSSIITALSDKALFPILSNIKNNDRTLVYLGKILSIIYVLAIPIIIIMAALSYQIVLLLLGMKWIAAVDYLEILMFAAIGAMVQSVNRGILKSLGQTRTIMKLSFSNAFLGIACILCGGIWGIRGILFGLLCSSILNALIYMNVLAGGTTFPVKSHFRILINPLLSSAFVFFIIKSLMAYLNVSTSLWGILFAPIGLLLYAILCIVTKNEAFSFVLTIIKNRMSNVFNK